MQINVIAVNNQTVPTAKGSYQKLEVTYKEVQGGKVGSRNIMSFVQESKKAFEALSTASNGETFNISMVKQAGKDGKEYWVWTDAQRGTAAASTGAAPQAATTVAKGSWETSEERAARQVYIIRQSSLANAIAALSVGSKTAPKEADILQLAKKFENFVFDGLTGDLVTDVTALEDPDVFGEPQ